jgi:hypothetical protein
MSENTEPQVDTINDTRDSVGVLSLVSLLMTIFLDPTSPSRSPACNVQKNNTSLLPVYSLGDDCASSEHAIFAPCGAQGRACDGWHSPAYEVGNPHTAVEERQPGAGI